MPRREDSFSIIINAGCAVVYSCAAASAAASAAATDVYESAAGVTYQQLDDATAPARRLASDIVSSATDTVGTVYAYMFVAPIIACNNSIQEVRTSLEASRAPCRLEYAISSKGDIYHAKHTSDVMKSLRKYKGGSRLEVKTFADFVAKDIIDKLIEINNSIRLIPPREYKDLLSPRSIKQLSMLQSTAIATSRMGLLNIDRLKEEFTNQYKGNKELLNTIPKERKRPPELPTTIPAAAELPNTTISGGFSALFSCCSDRGASRPKIQIRNTNTPVR